ncbi:MAG: DUF72 domain-containing protein [Bacteroidetes bacterium]|nr:MAG: DUF72 domain-containing protein [Bacteroidota bacterium]
MEFGRVTEKQLEQVNFRLPSEPAGNKKILKGKRAKRLKVYVGCAKWGRTEWIGKLYPPKTKEKDFLKYYVHHYNSIELNASHYKLYGPVAIGKWGALADGKDFKFCPKMYNAITHRGKLSGKNFLTNEFLRGVSAFKEHLGPVFVQVNELFGPKRKTELFDFLSNLPDDKQFFLEVRHPDWFAKDAIRKELFEKLRTLNIGAVITDTAGRRDCCHMTLTIPKAFIRFVGNSLHPTDYTRCDAWVKKVSHWLENGMKEIYFFMHMHDEATSPELTVYLVDKLNKECGLDLIRPTFISS